MKVTLSKALKLKARFIDSINESYSRFISGNISPVDSPSPYDSAEYFDKYCRQVAQLVDLKTIISKANDTDLIFRLAEAKTLLNRIAHINTNKPNHYGNTAAVEYVITIDTVKKDAMSKAVKEQIADLQDELDAYNAKTEVEIPELEF